MQPICSGRVELLGQLRTKANLLLTEMNSRLLDRPIELLRHEELDTTKDVELL